MIVKKIRIAEPLIPPFDALDIIQYENDDGETVYGYEDYDKKLHKLNLKPPAEYQIGQVVKHITSTGEYDCVIQKIEFRDEHQDNGLCNWIFTAIGQIDYVWKNISDLNPMELEYAYFVARGCEYLGEYTKDNNIRGKKFGFRLMPDCWDGKAQKWRQKYSAGTGLVSREWPNDLHSEMEMIYVMEKYNMSAYFHNGKWTVSITMSTTAMDEDFCAAVAKCLIQHVNDSSSVSVPNIPMVFKDKV